MPFHYKLGQTIAKPRKVRGQIFDRRDEHEKANIVHNPWGDHHSGSLFVQIQHTGCANTTTNAIIDE